MLLAPDLPFSGQHVLCMAPAISCGLWLKEKHWGRGRPGAGRSIPRTEETHCKSLGHVHFPSGVVSSLWPIDWKAEQWAAAAWKGDRTLGARGRHSQGTDWPPGFPHQVEWGRLLQNPSTWGWQQSASHDLKALYLPNPTPPPSRLSDGPNFKLKKQTNKSGILYPWGLFWFLKWRVYE